MGCIGSTPNESPISSADTSANEARTLVANAPSPVEQSTTAAESAVALDESVVVFDDPKSPTNKALVFIKPHASGNDAVRHLVLDHLKRAGCVVCESGVLTGPELDASGAIDRHYAAISSCAFVQTPQELFVSSETKKAFAAKFSVEWDRASRVNLKALFEANPSVTADEVDDAWNSSVRFKLSPGTYVARLENFGDANMNVFVVNGFYAKMRETYAHPDAKVLYYSIEFKESDLSWEKFRKNVVGSTDPRRAAKESIRHTLHETWRELGLGVELDYGNNGVHASAGPLEAIRERATWLGVLPHTDPTYVALTTSGVSPELVESWLANEVVPIDGETGPAFDLLEDKDESTLIALALRAQEERTSNAAPTKQRPAMLAQSSFRDYEVE